jgi:phosphopantothenoylcysteine decarboxylase/phosphopantothenate--cysteine ligase
MGACLATAALAVGHEVVVVSGPVQIEYPAAARIVSVVSTEVMLAASLAAFENCDGLIGAAAPCDYRPLEVADHKLRKTGQILELQLNETPDVVATLGKQKRPAQWTVGFALETEDARFRALTKLERKSCDLVILNGVDAIDSGENEVEIIEPGGNVIATFSGSKPVVATKILQLVQQRLVQRKPQ